jgi:uncharacterized membrane protein YphA (DoxX/SURF4 family)
MSVATVVDESPAAWPRIRPWLGTVARLALAGVFFAAGWSKITDLAASGRGVNAYRIVPYAAAKAIGAGLPFVEIALALLLLLGLAARFAAAVTGLLLVVYIVAISSVWARGMSINCGCFGNGGQLAAGQHPSYLPEILRDVGLLAVAAVLFLIGRTRLAVDNVLGTG